MFSFLQFLFSSFLRKFDTMQTTFKVDRMLFSYARKIQSKLSLATLRETLQKKLNMASMVIKRYTWAMLVVKWSEFHSDDSSSNPADAYSFSVKFMFEKRPG